MTRLRFLLSFAVAAFVCGGLTTAVAQKAKSSDDDVAAINALYTQWNQALATRGADGYVSFFVDDGAVLPPDGPAVEGKEAIRKWMQKSLADYEIKDAKMEFGPVRTSNGWAVRRFSLAAMRVPKDGGVPRYFNNKYLDVIQKQPDGQWKFVYRMWSSNEGRGER